MVKAPSHVAAIAVAAMPLISVCLAADSHSRVGYLSPDHKALARKAVAAARATGGRILEVQADGSGRYRTIQAAAAAAGAGDLVLVHPGMYRERLEITRGGKDGRPVVFKSVDVGVVIDGEKKRNCIVVRGDHVVVDGFECRNALLQTKHPDDGAI